MKKTIIDYLAGLRRHPYLTVGFGLAVSAMFLALFSELAAETLYENDLQDFDAAVTAIIRFPAGQTLDSVMLAFTWLGSGKALLLLTVTMMAIFVIRDWRGEAAALFVCLTGAGVLNQMLKVLFARSRPEIAVIEVSGYSFPSGHSMVSLCVYGFLAYLLSRRFSSFRQRGMVFLLVGAVVALIGVSRIYLGVHYPTDVLAGFVAGGTWLSCCMSWLHWREYRSGR
ncbi:MAG: phosphatase PAP2 family protein [Sporomusaceae bacterium]|nr:phosphatase PAP2 family protein [Sporomusaceae bacterium]